MPIEKLLSKHTSKPRNVNIASVFYKAGFIESWGRGILKIQNGFKELGLKSPIFEEDCGGVRVTLYRCNEIFATNHNQGKTKEKNKGETKEKLGRKTKEIILNLIKNNPYITQKEMQEYLGISKSGVEYQIRNLKKECVIKRKGSDRYGYWEIINNQIEGASDTTFRR